MVTRGISGAGISVAFIRRRRWWTRTSVGRATPPSRPSGRGREGAAAVVEEGRGASLPTGPARGSCGGSGGGGAQRLPPDWFRAGSYGVGGGGGVQCLPLSPTPPAREGEGVGPSPLTTSTSLRGRSRPRPQRAELGRHGDEVEVGHGGDERNVELGGEVAASVSSSLTPHLLDLVSRAADSVWLLRQER
jgi:hypothetical protein